MSMPDPTERALALQDTFEGAIKGTDHHAGACRDSGAHDEEAYLVHGAPAAAEPPGDEMADEAGPEPQAHHHRDHARWRDLRNQRQADGGEIELADGDYDEIGEQPPPTRRIAGRRPRRACHCARSPHPGASDPKPQVDRAGYRS